MEGTPFGRYRLIELLGRGGMGEVWRAHDTETKRTVAIKVLPAQLADDNEFVQRFRREAEAAAQLNSPHVIPIHHYGEIDGRLYVDMRLIEGRDLGTVLAGGPLEPARAVRIIEQVAKALHAAHKVGLIHRDIKPSNILLDDDDFAYLIDFGIARAADETRMTKTGNTIGTFAYIAPERLDGRADEDARVDIYSLACVLYEALTGDPPFAGDTMPRLIAAHLNAPPPRVSVARSDVPAQVDQVIATGMAKDPNQRYSTAIELANAAHDAITTPLAPPRQPTVLDNATRPARAPARHDHREPPPAYAPQPAWQQPAYLDPAGTPQHAPSWAFVPPPRSAGPAPPSRSTPPRRPWWRRQAIVIPAALLTVAVVVTAVVVIIGEQLTHSNGPHSALPTSTQAREPVYGPQVTLPFTGLNKPDGVGVDAAGDLFVTDMVGNRVLKLAAGSSTPIALPFTGLNAPQGVVVDAAGNVYVSNYNSGPVLKLAAASSTPTALPSTDHSYATGSGIAMDSAGDVFVADESNNRVLKLAAGSYTQTVLPFTGLNMPTGVAVDTAGNVYVTEFYGNRVVKLPAG